jgi:hypothetical protein
MAPQRRQEPADRPNPSELLRRPQLFEDATSFGVREDLLGYLTRDLLGPWGGPNEDITGKDSPRSRYLVGQLGPKELLPPGAKRDTDDAANDPDNHDDGENLNAGTEDPELPAKTADVGRLEASSMGLSFRVPAETEKIHVRATWGHYLKTSFTDEDGKPVSGWRRVPAGDEHGREVDLREDRQRIVLTGDDDHGVFLTVETRRRDDSLVVELGLVNGQREPQHNADEAWLFQPQLTVRALDGESAVFLPMDDPMREDARESAYLDAEDMRLRLLYRNRLQYTRGRNVAVHADEVPDERRARELRTEWMPVTDVPGTSAPTPEESALLAGLELSMTALAEADLETLRAGLAPLADGYRVWLEEQEARIAGLPEQLRVYAREALGEARTIADRIGEGVRLLTEPSHEHHAIALRAFRFAQRAMADQRLHTQIAAHRAANGSDYPTALAAIEAKGPAAASWRPFQLAFLLLNLASLADPGHPDRRIGPKGLVDLLFFPTGGGKTEAYLGLAAFTMAIRRLQGVTGSGEEARDAAAGVAVFMRYTLRLLTSQQFQRASALVCAAELLRRDAPEVYGDEPFRIGLWVGMKVTPNTYADAEDDIADMKVRGKVGESKTLQLQACPWCGERFEANAIETDEGRRRVLLYCPRSVGEGRCPFSRRSSPGEGIPVVSVDEEIYRLLPAFMIATVDKLAQLPWKGEAGLLFGQTRSKCPRHGYRHPDLDERIGCGGRHVPKGKLPAVVSEPVIRPRPWDLIIQDELHLISGALGTSVALFESAVDYLLQWETEDGVVGPKIVASTATTKRAAAQVKGIYNRRVAIFPPPVLDVEDTFFSKQDPITEKTPGRRYLGLCAHGVRLKQAEIRLWDTLLIAGQTLFDRYGAPADPYMTPVGYFNATRELAGMRRYLDDDVSIRVRRTRDGFSARLGSANTLRITELTSRIASSDISATLSELEQGFDPERDTAARRSAIGREMFLARKEKREPDPLAAELRERGSRTDAVLATSMLQVGVDVSRFGLMVVTGQPKNTAEYIQASSRVGRDANRPGLVVTLYNWTRPRDLDHYEDFYHYHDSYYRQVEALSVTPFTRRALDRGATGALVAAIRQGGLDASPNAAAARFDRNAAAVDDVVKTLIERAQQVKHPEAAQYLRERAETLFDDWEREKLRGGLVYRAGTGEANRAGLLRPADGTEWTTLTVANSMRETEGEAKLIFPPDHEMKMPELRGPQWTYGSRPDTEDGA